MREIDLHDRPALPRFVQLDWRGDVYGILLHSHHQHVRIPPASVHEYRPTPYGVRLVTQGGGRADVGAGPVTVKAGDLLLTTARERLWLEAGPDGMEMECMLFSWVPDPPRGEDDTDRLQDDLRVPFMEMLSGWSMEELTLESQPISLQSRNELRLLHLIRLLRHQLRPNHRVRWFAFHRAAFAVMAYLVEHVLVNEPPAASGESDLDQIHNLLESNYRQSLPIATLAARVGWSTSHLCRRFKAAYGCSPRQFQIDLRLRDAQCLLTTTNWSIARIAQEVGFESPDHFTRLFRRHTGSAPSDYRVAYQRGGSWPGFDGGDT